MAKRTKKGGISNSGDEIMGLIERDNMVLIPAAVTPHGHTGPLLNRLLYRHDAITICTPLNLQKQTKCYVILVKILPSDPDFHMTCWEEQTIFGKHHILANSIKDLKNQ